MRAITTHIFPEDGGWIVKRGGSASHRKAGVYSTQNEAILAARALVRRGYSGQIVVHRRNGSTTSKYVRGLPAIQSSPVKSSLGRKAIEKAVAATIRERLAGE